MKTLSKTITKTFFKEESGYQAMCKIWGEKIRNREELPAEVHLLYLALRGKNWTKGFVAGSFGAHGAPESLRVNLKYYKIPTHINSHLSTFGDLFQPDVAENLLKLLPDSYSATGDPYKDLSNVKEAA